MTATAVEGPVVTLDDIRLAAKVLAPVAVRTPLLADDLLTQRLGADIIYKAEVLQRSGTFKFRGAYNFLSSLPSAVRARGVVAPSSGNHGQGVAMAARIFGVPATVVMPTNATPAKRAGVERLGAKIVLAGTTTPERAEKALEICRTEAMTLVHPYDDPTIIAGQGTIGLEILADLSDVDTVLVPVGGGGLSSGVATAIRSVAPHVAVIGVEPTLAADAAESLAAGELRIWPTELTYRTSADGLRTNLSALTLAHLRAYLAGIVTVTEEEILSTVAVLARSARIVAEPSGAVAAA